MQNPGRTLLLMVALCAQLLGSVNASVDHTNVTQGDTVSLRIDVVGTLDETPVVDRLCGEKVTTSSQERSLYAEKGAFRKSILLSYEFTAKHDCTIEPIDVMVDGRIEHTDAIDIKVKAMNVTPSSPFVLSMQTARDHVYVGEPFQLDIVFSQSKSSGLVDSRFQPPRFRDVWVKAQREARRHEGQARKTSTMSFVLSAQRSGVLKIAPAEIKVATRSRTRDTLGQSLPVLRWRTYYSNALELQVLPLPAGVDLVGTFTISAEVEADHVDAGEAVSMTLRIEGSGDLEDIDLKKPKLDGVMVYPEKPQISYAQKEGPSQGVWTQKRVFVSQSSFVIPAFEIRYFDPLDREIRLAQTPPIPIQVEGKVSKATEPLRVERAVSKTDQPPFIAGSWPLAMMIGIVVGALGAFLALLRPWRKWSSKRRGTKSTYAKGDDRAGLQALINHLDDKEALEMAMMIEANLYGDEETDIDQGQLRRLLKRLRRSRRLRP